MYMYIYIYIPEMKSYKELNDRFVMCLQHRLISLDLEILCWEDQCVVLKLGFECCVLQHALVR